MSYHRALLIVAMASVFLLPFAAADAQTIWYVDADAPGVPDGQAWATAFKDLQAALAAAESGDEIWVANGTYFPDGGTQPTGGVHTPGSQDRQLSFNLSDDVGIYGGFEGGDSVTYPGGETLRTQRNSDPDTNATILSGDIDGNDGPEIIGENSYHVVVGSGTTETAVIEGFRITGGLADGDDEEQHGGGVLCSSGSPTLANCTIAGNTATYSGGVYCYDNSSPILTNCTINLNSGRGVYCSQNSCPTLTNCTISGNRAFYGGGVYCYDNSSPTLTNCTINLNSGHGVYCSQNSSPTLTNCILWGDTAGTGPEIYIRSASTVSISYSAVEGGEAAAFVDFGCTLEWGEGNITADPLLTRSGTHLEAGSPCLDAGDPAGDYTGRSDIDGEPRVVNGRVDIGADEFFDSDADGLPDWWESFWFGSATAGDPAGNEDGDGRLNIDEYRLSSDPLQTPRTYYVDVAGDDAWDGLAPAWDGLHGPKATIQAAIDVTVMYEGDEIVVADGTYVGGGNRELDFRGREITLRSAGGAAACVINCEGQGRGFHFHSGETAFSVVHGFTITGGAAVDGIGGGGVRCLSSSPTLTHCTISGNTARSGGGVSCEFYSNPMMMGCTISANTADYVGGGMHCTQYSRPTLTHCTISGNMADQYHGGGGGVYCQSSSSPTLTDCTITGNTAGQYDGGGVYCYSSSPTLTDCTISGNTAGAGGGVFCEGPSYPTLTRCTISGNTADDGGGVGCFYSEPTLTDCTISNNTADSSGGGVCCGQSSATLTRCAITGNTAYFDGGGGGVYCHTSSPTLTHCTISGNTAYSDGGGGVYCVGYGNPTLTHCTISGNMALLSSGGGVYCMSSSPTLTNCRISGNKAYVTQEAGGIGGGVYCSSSSPTLTNCTINGNTADDCGGGMHCSENSSLTLTNCILWGDRSPNGPEIGLCSSSTVTISYSVVEGGEAVAYVGSDCTLEWGEGNITTDPLLTRDGWHLRAESPCWNAGDPAGDYTDQSDIDGEPRVLDGRVDIGPDEFLDSDVDGLPDWWESRYFGSPTAGDPAGNDDGDDRLNIDEYRLGTNPLLPPLTYYVDLTGDDAWDGLAPGWDGLHGPKATIQAAIDATAMYEGDEIVVADGTYTGVGNRDLDFGGRESTLRSAGGAAACVIDCEGQGRGFYFHSGETALLRVDGFTIVGGNADFGGGVYCDRRSNPMLTNCTISGNKADYGGGVYFYDSSPMLTNCTINGNTTDDYGGGVFCEGPSDSTLTNCTISLNGGGGVCCTKNSSPTLVNCTISLNGGRGVYCYRGHPTLVNCTISLNGGRGVSCSHCNPMLTNCILWGDGAGEIYVSSYSTLSISYSAVEGGEAAAFVDSHCTLEWGEGNITADPLLTHNGTHLRADSPCLDAGDPAGDYTGQSDIDGEPRVVDGRVDIGPDEFLDSDADGLPDWWESLYFGSPVAGDPAGNEDGDDRLNLDEYLFGSNPFQAPLNYYVDLTGDDAWDGLAPGWDGTHGPKATIQAAIDATAMYEGDEIVVADGTYTGVGNRDLDLGGRGITLRSVAGAAACVIDCEGQGRGFYFHSGETALSRVDGFAIVGGNADFGGGVYCRDNSSPTLTDCTVSGNTSSSSGGGVYCCNKSSPTLTKCMISGNTTDGGGGGVYCRDNSSPTLTDCRVNGNTSSSSGGGVYCYNKSSPTLTNCTISGNAADRYGGGMYCSFSEPTLMNCTINGNTADDYGGGMHCSENSSPTLTNCILWGDSAATGPEIYVSFSSTVTVSYSAVQGGEAAAYVDTGSTLDWGPGNITADPLFIAPGYWDDGGTPGEPDDDVWVEGDYRLQIGPVPSPCIDAGDNAVVTTATDIEGLPRRFDIVDVADTGSGTAPIVDMGAHEARVTCPGDLDFSGQVDMDDLAAFIDALLADEPNSLADVIEDGTVNGLDIQAMIDLVLASGGLGTSC